LQNIVVAELLCHSRYGFADSIKNFGRVLASFDKLMTSVRFLIVITNCVGYFTFSFINSVKVIAKLISAKVS
jgi:hypothetical protein